MIASGLCVMGGCFAQSDDSLCVDTYWPAQCVRIPAYTDSGSVGLLEVDVPVGVEQSLFYVRAKQVSLTSASTVSVFFARQGGITPLNAYHAKPVIEITNNKGGLAQKALEYHNLQFPLVLCFESNGGDGSFPDLNMKVSACKWNPANEGFARVLDAREWEKDFCYSYGNWGKPWYILPMRSETCCAAVYEVMERSLIEL